MNGDRIWVHKRIASFDQDNVFLVIICDICNYICLDTSDHFSVLPS